MGNKPTSFEEKAITLITNWFERKASHVINIAAGPKRWREHWFNAEAIVALSHGGGLGRLVVFGEQAYEQVISGTTWKSDPAADLAAIADIVGFAVSNGSLDIRFVIESKILYRHSEKRAKQLNDLKKQLLETRKYCSSSVGVIYLIAWPGDFVIHEKTHRFSPDATGFFTTVEGEVSKTFHITPFVWLRKPAPLVGMNMASTTFLGGYPKITITVGLAAIKLE